MKIIVEDRVLKAYPELSIGLLMAKVDVKKSDAEVEKMKANLPESEGMIAVSKYPSIDKHPTIHSWRKTYQDFGVKPKEYLSAVESLVRRVSKGQSIWNISNVVDLYNCVSVQTVIPMGAYDMTKIIGDISLRYGVVGETFTPLGAKPGKPPVLVNENHVVYADDEKVLTWLWNNKDSGSCCVDEKTKYALFFADIAKPSELHEDVGLPIKLLETHLLNMGMEVIYSAIINRDNPTLELPGMSEMQKKSTIGMRR